MPLYEYQCGSCGHRFERIQKFSDALVAECPKCGGQVEKLISSPAIQFKGSGWYVNDYAKAGKSEGKSSSAKSDTAAESKSDKASTETKADKSEKPASSESSKPATPSADKP